VALRVAEIVGQFADAEVLNVVAVGRVIQAGEPAHAIGDGVIGAGGVTAYAEPADHLPVRIKWNAAAERDDAAGDIADGRSLLLKCRIERIGIIQPVELTSRKAPGRESFAVGWLGK